MKRFGAMVLMLCLLLSGCSTWLDGSYYSIKPHEEKQEDSGSDIVAVSSYSALCRALASMASNGTTNGVISVKNYNQLVVARDMLYAVEHVKKNDPIGAYAVEDMEFELGTNAGQPAIAVSISYYHDRTELQKIHRLADMAEAEQTIGEALDSCDSGLVLYVSRFQDLDYVQWVEDYSSLHADRVMEMPQVAVNVYPETGTARVLELRFTYQNSRESLRTMQEQVEGILSQVVTDAGNKETEREMYKAALAALPKELTSRDTSITPAYSLLLHGVGDSKAISSVYSSVCNRLELNCITVTGTYQGQPRSWNILQIDGAYFHTDLLRSLGEGDIRPMTDSQMTGYVWDYFAYPVCSGVPEPSQPEGV